MTIRGIVDIAEGLSQGKPCIKVFMVNQNSELLRRLPETLEGYLPPNKNKAVTSWQYLTGSLSHYMARQFVQPEMYFSDC